MTLRNGGRFRSATRQLLCGIDPNGSQWDLNNTLGRPSRAFSRILLPFGPGSRAAPPSEKKLRFYWGYDLSRRRLLVCPRGQTAALIRL
jgi:hypothetical protein